jgi:hypothetical protein
LKSSTGTCKDLTAGTPLHACTIQTSLITRTLQVRLLLLPLDLVQEVKVRLVEVVHAHVTVLTSTAVRGALRVHGDVVEGSEVATDATNLLGEDLVVETGLEFTLAGRGGCDIHGGLATTEDNVVFYGGNGSAVEGCVGNVCLEDGKLFGVDELERLASVLQQLKGGTLYLCGLVLGGSDEVCAVC